MRAHEAAPGSHKEALPRFPGSHGALVTTWGMAGGILAGGIVFAVFTLAGRMSAHALFATATGLFVVGAALGMLHGAVLGYLGHPTGTSRRTTMRDLGLGTLYAVPGLSVAWLITIWIAMTPVAIFTQKPGAVIGVSVGWILGLAMVAMASYHGWRVLHTAYARWPDRRVGTLLVGATFAALLIIFLSDQPVLFDLRLHLTETGAILLAAGVALWVVGPLVTVALRMLHSIPIRMPMAGLMGRSWGFTDLAVGLVVGSVLGMLIVPFAGPTPVDTSLAGLVTAASQAVVAEVLLRLGAVTGVAWILFRWNEVHPEEAAVGAVAVAAVAQGLLYLPGTLQIGFPSLLDTASFILTTVIVPAAVFGVLFWRRGFGTALVADAWALVLLALLVR